MERRGRRRARRWLAPITGLVVLALVAQGAVRPAAADDDPVPVVVERDLFGVVDGAPVFHTKVQVTTNGDVITVSDDRQLGQVCVPGAGDEQICTGRTSQPQDFVISRDDGKAASRAEAAAALGWIQQEGVPVLAAQYGVPDDGRLERYARGALRAYTVARLVDIFDKVAFGEPLTFDEHRALRFVQGELLRLARDSTRFALEEYERWVAQGCDYVPPAPPAYVTDPMPMPDDVTMWCQRAKSRFDTLITTAPPIPSVAHFETWATYRHAAELDLDVLDNPDFVRNLIETQSSRHVVGALVPVVGVGTAVGTAAAIETYVSAALTWPGLHVPLGLGAGSAAAVLGIILVSVAILAVTIWQLDANAAIPRTLVERANAAAASTDVFDLAALAEANQDAGITLAQGRARFERDPASVPAYRQPAWIERLEQLVTVWTTVPETGTPVPDPSDVWPDDATAAGDYTFRVVEGGQQTDGVETITVPLPDGRKADVRFDREWMIVTEYSAEGVPGATYPTLTVEYVDHNGDRVLMTRDPRVPDDPGEPFRGVVLVTEDGSTTPTGSYPAIHYVDEDGDLVSARVMTPPAPPRPYELVPTVAGPLLPGRVHNLRPNPVGPDGTFDLATFTEDYDYTWAVRRFDPAVGADGDWVVVGGVERVARQGNPGYGARFTPTTTGEYEAVVTLSHRTDGTVPTRAGTVRFTVVAPEIRFDKLAVVDDPVADTLRVDLQLGENVPTDELEVTIQWPGQVGSDAPGPTSSVTLPCHTTDVVVCSTVDTALAPELTALDHALTPLSDLRREITVTVANTYGAVVTRSVPIDSSGRPTLTAAPPPAPDQPGVVRFDPYGIHVQIPVSLPSTTNPNYRLATVVPGAPADESTVFQLVDPTGAFPSPPAFVPAAAPAFTVALVSPAVTGGSDWMLELRGLPDYDDIGTYEIPIVVQQSPGGRVTTVLHLHVVAAPDDRYRGGLLSEIDPLAFGVEELPDLTPMVLGGETDWEEHPSRLCLGLTDSASGRSSEVCGDVGELHDAEGVPLPFPYARLLDLGPGPGRVEARAWLDEDGDDLPDDKASYEPFTVVFNLATGPPFIAQLVWGPDTGTFVIEIEPYGAAGSEVSALAVGPPVPIESVTCWLDDVPVEACFDAAGGSWDPGDLAPGPHALRVLVTDATGNYHQRSLEFSVAGPGEPGGPGDPGGPEEPGGPGEPGAPSGPGGGTESPGTPGADGSADGPGEASHGAGGLAFAGTDIGPWMLAVVVLLVVGLTCILAARARRRGVRRRA